MNNNTYVVASDNIAAIIIFGCFRLEATPSPLAIAKAGLIHRLNQPSSSRTVMLQPLIL
ncbi:MAG: hypothetical protein LJE83_06990 [Gammaproteobacteria bacterium]|nr:hypothetical protein [Gammaproteobacteria bacterium]